MLDGLTEFVLKLNTSDDNQAVLSKMWTRLIDAEQARTDYLIERAEDTVQAARNRLR